MFEDLSLEIGASEFVSFLAPSGLGKTTLFRIIAGLLEPEAGRIELNGTAGSAKTRLGRVGYMPQRDCLMPWRTVWENAALALEVAGTSKREAKRQVLELLPSFGLQGTEMRFPDQLSGGMRQRVSFLRTLLGGGELLLLDEPFSALDAITRLEMQEWLLEVWERNRKTILFITHDVEEALLLSDRVLVAYEAPIRELVEFRVPLSRPRSFGIATDAALSEAKAEILKLLRGTGGTGRSKAGLPVLTAAGGIGR
ncbi:ABC transporter ATP-binding protein [Gorillibacterium sp. sgz5001074]|uniref:ABC transporter ATP-binding protein n=1 Tax=Gorillibacterium sp. sgz5001074 TaxID=3446695 RepID=UPI003F676FFF